MQCLREKKESFELFPQVVEARFWPVYQKERKSELRSGEYLVEIGIMVCELNGAGKSTLGKALASALNFYSIDNEAPYFPKAGPQYAYAVLIDVPKDIRLQRVKNAPLRNLARECCPAGMYASTKRNF